MRIIKQGTPPPISLLKGECRNCKTVAEAKTKELKSLGAGFYVATCPVCQDDAMLFRVDRQNIPTEEAVQIRTSGLPNTATLGLKGEWSPPKDGDA